MDEMVTKLTTLMEKLNVGAEDMWPRALRYVQVDAIGGLVVGVILLLSAVGLCLFSKYWVRHAKKNRWNEEVMVVPAIIAVIGALVLFPISIGMLWNGIVTLIEPAPIALKLLMRAIR